GVAGLQTGQIPIAHGRVIHASDGAVRGFVIAAFQPQSFIEQLPVALASDARLILIDERGRMLFATEGTSLEALDDVSGEPAVRDALGGMTIRLDGVETP